ncbi:MAG: metallophosphoesterase, partial [Bacteroidales bacterium]|nr:metallophosphoesterase [Bacteroidales bacterium]
ALPGNHDERPYTSETHAAFLAFNGYDRFSFMLDGVAFIGFDSCPIKDGDVAAEEEQLDWLKAELTAARKARQILLFTHCPVVRETLDEPEDYFNFSIPKREEYLSLFKEYGVDALFAGHTHTCYYTEIDGIQFITAGPVGSPLHNGFSGLNVVKAAPDGITYQYTTCPEATVDF